MNTAERCKVGALTADDGPLTPEDRATLADALTAPERVAAGVLVEALGRLGHRVGTTTVKDHRGSRCVCAREDTSR